MACVRKRTFTWRKCFEMRPSCTKWRQICCHIGRLQPSIIGPMCMFAVANMTVLREGVLTCSVWNRLLSSRWSRVLNEEGTIYPKMFPRRLLTKTTICPIERPFVVRTLTGARARCSTECDFMIKQSTAIQRRCVFSEPSSGISRSTETGQHKVACHSHRQKLHTLW